MRISNIAMTVASLMFISLPALAQGGEKKIGRADLPAAVQKTVDAESKNATIRGYSKEVEKGKTYFEVEMLVSGHSKDVLMDGNGKVVEIEEEVALNSIPPEVKKGLEAKAGSGKIGKIESLTKQGKLVAYEAKVTAGTHKSEIQVGPMGQSLDHEE